MNRPFADRFWDPDSTYLVQPPLTDQALVEAQQRLGVTLPADYVALLRVRNGGRVSKGLSAHPTTKPTSWAPDHVPFTHCFGIGDAPGSILESPALNDEWDQPSELVLLHGDGHWWIALDYRNRQGQEPRVVWFDNEVGQDLLLADSFNDFLNGLAPAP